MPVGLLRLLPLRPPQPVAVAADRHHVAVVQQPIENGGCHHLIAKDLVSLLYGAVGADQHAALLIPAGIQLEEQVPRRWFERQVAQFIDDQQLRLGVLRQTHLLRPLLLRLDQGPQARPAQVRHNGSWAWFVWLRWYSNQGNGPAHLLQHQPEPVA